MVGIAFESYVGPGGDVRELEYISALMQTDLEGLRPDGSIQVVDIIAYLASRHGIRVKASKVKEAIVDELCGTSPDALEPNSIDLCQIVGLLLIPYLIGVVEDSVGKTNVDKVFNLILNEVRYLDKNAVKENVIELTPHLLEAVLKHFFGSTHKIPPQVLFEMMKVAGTKYGEVCKLNRDNFMQALTNDVRLYNLNWEESNTTYFEDSRALAVEDKQAILLEQRKKEREKRKREREEAQQSKLLGLDDEDKEEGDDENKSTENEDDDDDEKEEQQVAAVTTEDDDNTELVFRKFTTWRHLDSTSDTIRNPLINILLWFFILNTYFLYFFNALFSLPVNCNFDQFGCQVSHGVVNWLWIFLQLILFGGTTMLFTTIGNFPQDPTKRNKKICFSLSIVIFSMGIMTVGGILARFFEVETEFFETYKTDTEDDHFKVYEVAYWLAFSTCLAIMVLQFLRVVRFWVPFSIPYITDSGIRMEKSTKLAAKYKISKLVKNALLMHRAPDKLAKMKKKKDSLKALDAAIVELYDEGGISYNSTGLAQAIVNYQYVKDVKQKMGGIQWAWGSVLDGTLFVETGIWLHSRLLATNFAQIFNILFIASLVTLLTKYIEDTYEDFLRSSKNELDYLAEDYADEAVDLSLMGVNITSFIDNLIDTWKDEDATAAMNEAAGTEVPHVYYFNMSFTAGLTAVTAHGGEEAFNNILAVLELWDSSVFNSFFIDIFERNIFLNATDASGSLFINGTTGVYNETEGVFFYNETSEEFDYEWASNEDFSLIPEKWEAVTSFVVGGVFALASTLGIALVHIPSFVSTVLKFRTGFIGSLKDHHFLPLRQSLDTTTMIFGTAFWGAFFTGISTLVMVIPITFFFMWNVTRGFVLQIAAQAIGIAVVLILQIIVLFLIRRYLASSFYRPRPALMNFLNLILELWSISIAAGLMALRTLKLFLTTAFYVGRIDTPMLAPGVGNIGKKSFDVAPTPFQRDLLQHEAHRHPYIERLGLFYLMKLRHGDEFGTVAGAYWRMLFVTALMPWMRAYRGRVKEEEEDDSSDDEEGAKKVEHKDRELEELRRTNLALLVSTRNLTTEIEKLRELIEKDKKTEMKSRRMANKDGPVRKADSSMRGSSRGESTRGSTKMQRNPSARNRMQAPPSPRKESIQNQPAAPAEAPLPASESVAPADAPLLASDNDEIRETV